MAKMDFFGTFLFSVLALAPFVFPNVFVFVLLLFLPVEVESW